MQYNPYYNCVRYICVYLVILSSVNYVQICFSIYSTGKRCYISRVPRAVRAGVGQADAARQVQQEQSVRAVLPRGLDLLPDSLREARQRRCLTTTTKDPHCCSFTSHTFTKSYSYYHYFRLMLILGHYYGAPKRAVLPAITSNARNISVNGSNRWQHLSILLHSTKYWRP